MEVREARELLESNLALVGRVVGFACHRYRFDADEAEDFASIVNLKLVENDFAVLRSYEGRSTLSTYLSIVVQRWAIDYRIHAWGKWHASAEAKRMGALAVELEQLLHRDGRSLDEALPFLATKYPGVTLDSLAKLAAQFPTRAPKRHQVPIEEAESIETEGPRDIEERALADDRHRTAERVCTLIRDAIGRRPDDDRLILQFRFEQGMTVAQIARAMQRDQKFLYRQIERCMREIRAEIEKSGLAPADVLDLIGRDETFLAFDLGKEGPRPSKESDERVAASAEGLA